MLAGLPVGQLGTKGIAGVAVLGALAGYGLTTYFLRRWRAGKIAKANAAAELADAYRLTRLRAAEQLGRELTRPELDQLAREFRRRVDDEGLTNYFWRK